ncbi:uncharacterized protein PHACADRAFT_263934 [Phanerochaete carnosa HHB-10118-sp]|uniref:Uncharacterized protein n=1 Tax=Phanerochaete carnosa (strain HHB-10118-sp) TaxID=650164 RepID=K5ULM5_PHACS|nr:uncharacterized protein PHACADRAFT_263934 [Phanerochaete carnosa HHB-10118-sp]EKM50581.1 hypothetical protein PHACADRAFT_263934 [Phanerochaete carnosa HHB-10118-sp]
MNLPTLPTLTDIEVSSLVQEFNSLPRRHIVPSGPEPNKWVFGLHVVPIPPAGYLLFIVNPASGIVQGEGPLPIETRPLSTSEQRDRGRKIAILLLKAFVSKLGRTDAPEYYKVAPWEWVAEDTQLAASVSSALQALGVRSELCDVGVATEQERDITTGRFAGFLEDLVRTMRAAREST